MTDITKLTKYAINYLSKFSSSKSNLEYILKKKIRNYNIDKKQKFLLYNSLSTIIYNLEKNNFINDRTYCLSKIRFFIHQGKSKIYMQSYFYQKGIEKEIVLEAFQEYDLNDSDWELESAKIFVRKKRLENKPEYKEKNLSKMARAGYKYDLCIKILNEF
ncbi:RecX family transcriptional regulator [Alphaproteobacteria bacterium]|nr:RecX family transcriptional regulator [Alphaproteobacteria bacterium]